MKNIEPNFTHKAGLAFRHVCQVLMKIRKLEDISKKGQMIFAKLDALILF